MAKTIEFVVENSKPFSTYLKKFNSIDNTVLFEIDGEDLSFITKAPNEERSIVKYCKSSFSESEFTLSKKFNYRVKIGIYNILRFIKMMDQFDGEFQFIIKYDEIVGDGKTDYAGISILLKNNDLKFNIECTSLSIFGYITDELWENTISKIDSLISFDFTKENIEKINSLCELDKEYKFIEFKNKNGNLYAKGKTFEYLLVPTLPDIDLNLAFYKDQFDKIDLENYNVQMGLDRMVFSSRDTNTISVISRTEGNENYDEKNKDPFN